MILTMCTVCAAPLPEEAVRCSACATGYCSERCERSDRRRGGHGKICGAISSGGGAEQYHADKKYKEAVADAIEDCAEDTAGQTCYICLEDGSEEGLVRGCACRGAAGFAHVSCLAEQAKILCDDVEENRTGTAIAERWRQWGFCNLCKQSHHGVVNHALGWACWKTYVGRPETDIYRDNAMKRLVIGLSAVDRTEERLQILMSQLATATRLGYSEERILSIKMSIANCHGEMDREEEALALHRDVYARRVALGASSKKVFINALNLGSSLMNLQRYAEARSFILEQLPKARSALGVEDDIYAKLRWSYAVCLHRNDGASLHELVEAVAILEHLSSWARQVYGPAHPLTESIQEDCEEAQGQLASFKDPEGISIEDLARAVGCTVEELKAESRR